MVSYNQQFSMWNYSRLLLKGVENNHPHKDPCCRFGFYLKNFTRCNILPAPLFFAVMWKPKTWSLKSHLFRLCYRKRNYMFFNTIASLFIYFLFYIQPLASQQTPFSIFNNNKILLEQDRRNRRKKGKIISKKEKKWFVAPATRLSIRFIYPFYSFTFRFILTIYLRYRKIGKRYTDMW